TLMLHITLGGFDQVGNQVVAPFELHVDLGERIFETIAEGDESIIDAGGPKAEHDYDQEQYSKDDEDGRHDEVALTNRNEGKAQCVGIGISREMEVFTTRFILSTPAGRVVAS